MKIHGMVMPAIDAYKKGNPQPMKALLQTVLHAAIGGFSAGFIASFAGANFKQSLFAGGASALTSVVSLFTNAPKS